MIKKVFYELALNALKYSITNTTIVLIFEIKDNHIIIQFLNRPITLKIGISGAPEEYDHIILDPFFRMGKVINEQYGAIEYRIVLTLCEKIIKKYGSSIGIFNTVDQSDIGAGPLTWVCYEIKLAIKN